MSKREKHQIEPWVAEGVISSTLGMLLMSKTNKKQDSSIVGHLFAALYEIHPDGKKSLIKNLDDRLVLPKKFMLK